MNFKKSLVVILTFFLSVNTHAAAARGAGAARQVFRVGGRQALPPGVPAPLGRQAPPLGVPAVVRPISTGVGSQYPAGSLSPVVVQPRASSPLIPSQPPRALSSAGTQGSPESARGSTPSVPLKLWISLTQQIDVSVPPSDPYYQPAFESLKKIVSTFESKGSEGNTRRRTDHMLKIASGSSRHLTSSVESDYNVPNSGVPYSAAACHIAGISSDLNSIMAAVGGKGIKFDHRYLTSLLQARIEYKDDKQKFQDQLNQDLGLEEQDPGSLPFADLKSAAFRQGYHAEVGSARITEGTLVQGSREFVEGGIGHYYCDFQSHPIFELLRHVSKSLKDDSTMSIQEKITVLQVAVNKLVLNSPDYSCPALKSLQRVSGMEGAQPLSAWAKSGTGDCRPHSLILAAAALEAGIEAEYTNMEFEHGVGPQPTIENHSVVTFKDEKGDLRVADSFLPKFHGAKVSDLKGEGVIIPETGERLFVRRSLAFPEILSPPAEEEVELSACIAPQVGERDHSSGPEVGQRVDKALVPEAQDSLERNQGPSKKQIGPSEAQSAR